MGYILFLKKLYKIYSNSEFGCFFPLKQVCTLPAYVSYYMKAKSSLDRTIQSNAV